MSENDAERRGLVRRESDERRRERDRSYDALEERIKDLCNRVNQLQEAWRRQSILQERLEKAMREDHDLVVSKIAELGRMQSIERDVKQMMSYFDNASGAGRMLALLVTIIGALGAYVVYLQGTGSG